MNGGNRSISTAPAHTGSRGFFIQNACYWISEFHMDGLRLDAVHAIHDESPVHVLGDMSRQARLAAGARLGDPDRRVRNAGLIEPIQPIEQGGSGIWMGYGAKTFIMPLG